MKKQSKQKIKEHQVEAGTKSFAEDISEVSFSHQQFIPT